MNNHSQLAPTINLVDVLRGIVRHKLLIALMTLLAFGSSAFYVKKSSYVYTTQAQILIENLASPYDRTQSSADERTDTIDDRIVLSQVSVLKSRDLAVGVVRALKLEEKPEFDSLKGGELGTTQKMLLALGFGEDPRLMSKAERALKRYFSHLLVYQVPESNVVAIKYSANDPAVAANVANTLVKLYVESTAETRLRPTNRAREWLGGQIDDLRKKLAGSEAAIESFRAEAGLLKGSTTTLNAQQLSELNSQITLAGTARTDAEERAKSINELLASRGNVDESSDVLSSPNVQRLREQQVSAARAVAELSATYLPNHPKMIAAQNQMNNINRQIRSEALKVVQGLDEQARIAQAREDSLRARLEEMKGSESLANQDDVKLQAMERDAAADKALLETLLLRYADASSRQNLSTQPALARIIEQAAPPASPSFPKPGPTVLLATLAGLIMALGLSFLMEVMTTTGGSREQKQAATIPATVLKEPVLVPAAPPSPPKPSIMALAKLPSLPNSADIRELLSATAREDDYGLGEAGSQMASWAAALPQSAKRRQVAIISWDTDIRDSSLAAVIMARSISSLNLRVVVVDLATHGSCVEMFFGLAAGPGFVDLLSGKADFTKVIARDTESNVHLLRFGFTRDDAAMALLAQRTEVVLQALGTIYDVVIVHVGEASENTHELIPNCQGVVMLASAENQIEASVTLNSIKTENNVDARLVVLEQTSLSPVKRAASA